MVQDHGHKTERLNSGPLKQKVSIFKCYSELMEKYYGGAQEEADECDHANSLQTYLAKFRFLLPQRLGKRGTIFLDDYV